jgi:phosphatidylinositol 4-phosphatase
LREIGILKENDIVDNHHSFFSVFKNVWANNADQISMMYSGTGALKNDFTRTGFHFFQLIQQEKEHFTVS